MTRLSAPLLRWQVIDAKGSVTAVAEPEQESAGPLETNWAACKRAADRHAGHRIRRSVWEDLGGFDPRLECAEDWENVGPDRGAVGVWYEPALLAAYRSHQRPTAAAISPMRGELHYTRRAMELFRPLLPKDRARSIIASARRAYARTALDNARQLASEGRSPAMWAHLRMAGRLWPRLTTLREAARVAWRRAG